MNSILDIHRFLSVVPESEHTLKRLNRLLANASEPPRIAVLGKYNHGKSTLLNALVGAEKFRVADKRETTEIAEYEHDGVVWIDTPGLDGDPLERDDRKAWGTAFQLADFLFLAHQVQAGELDRYEERAFLRLARQDRNYSRKMHLLLTQIDQREPDEVAKVERTVRDQLFHLFNLKEFPITSVSADRYQRGIGTENAKLREMSGMVPIFATVKRIKSEVTSRRKRETRKLADKLLVDLDDKLHAIDSKLTETNNKRRKMKRRLTSDAQAIIDRLTPYFSATKEV